MARELEAAGAVVTALESVCGISSTRHDSPRAPAPPLALPGSASSLTDLCSCGNVPEVEIISLLGEQLPHYTLRADTLFGYEHDDWLHRSLLPPEAPTPLTPQQIEETLKYFRRGWWPFPPGSGLPMGPRPLPAGAKCVLPLMGRLAAVRAPHPAPTPERRFRGLVPHSVSLPHGLSRWELV
ncbi:Trafficking kinesin-binding protein 1 [Chelonia mydas]|uniref:Trafficking kinesin-binding protein 1 n=1 Tax=Chelonia mydas TaxID=8469 RepID=M7C7G7_CHEMY|nr:Trafficking kinesin-binding protein 1 [Chelonia mydas]